MRVTVSDTLPAEAKAIREAVFMEEQGFQNEFDDTDGVSRHLLLWEEGSAVGVCRVFPGETPGAWIFGRLAVLPPFRGRGFGAELLRASEELVSAEGGRTLSLHAQCRAAGFYARLGYTEYGDVELDEGCPHIWMRKRLDE